MGNDLRGKLGIWEILERLPKPEPRRYVVPQPFWQVLWGLGLTFSALEVQ